MKLYYTNKDVALHARSPASGHELGMRDALDEWDCLSDAKGSFMALRYGDSQAVRFVYEDADTIRLEITTGIQGEVLAKISDYEECCKVIRGLYHGEDPVALLGSSLHVMKKGASKSGKKTPMTKDKAKKGKQKSV